MTPLVPTVEPSELTAGETVRWTKSVPDYPSEGGWTLRYYFRGASAPGAKAAAGGVAGAYAVQLTAAETALFAKGHYRWAAYAERGAGDALERYLITGGTLLVHPNLVAAGAGAMQSHAERMLAAISAVLEKRVTDDVASYKIGDRELTKIPIEELKRLQAKYARAVWRERNPGKLGPQVAMVFRG